MDTAVPTSTDDWLHEVLHHFEVAAMAAAGQGFEDSNDQQQWIDFIQRQAISLCRLVRGLSQAVGVPEHELGDIEKIDDIAHAIRDDLPGDLREVVSETQLFLLFYLAAHVHTGLIPRSHATSVVTACWHACAGDSDDTTWAISRDPPTDADGWADEIIAAYGEVNSPVSLPVVEGDPFVAQTLLDSATVLALRNRGVLPQHEGVVELVDTIRAMEQDVSSMGPEWADMCRIAPMAFSMYYVWVHLAIGLTDEATAMQIMQTCTKRIGDFPEP